MVRTKSSWLARREEIEGYLCISPWLIGFLAFLVFPLLFSIYLSFTSYDYVSAPKWVGLANYQKALQGDPLFWRSLRVTFSFSAMALPLDLLLSFSVALLLNLKGRGMGLFRTIYYLPAILPLVAVSILWLWIFNPQFGILNWALGLIGIKGPTWLFDPDWALFALVIMSLWGIGRAMIIYLAGLQNINPELYDAVKVDGAGMVRSFWHVTIPMMTPVIFFNLIMGVIGAFQVFAQAFIMTRGGPVRSTYFYMLYLYDNAFQFFKAGYASALAWLLFVIILFFTLLILRSSTAWVYYEGELRGR
ncbi:MAG: sugar ABC transporter permease [Anaerolineae bacterium]|nr:sugar ABC transporter permease [Anaerolineae bacterium]